MIDTESTRVKHGSLTCKFFYIENPLELMKRELTNLIYSTIIGDTHDIEACSQIVSRRKWRYKQIHALKFYTHLIFF